MLHEESKPGDMDMIERITGKLGDLIDEIESDGLFNHWKTIYNKKGFRIQRDRKKENYRLIDHHNDLICKGTKLSVFHRASKYFELPKLMKKDLRETLNKIKKMNITPGDVLGVDRFFHDTDGQIRMYRHFGIYVGKQRVIHYAAENGAFSLNQSEIHEASILDFIQESDSFYVLDFDERGEKKPVERKLRLNRYASRKKTKWFVLVPVLELLDATMGSREKYKVFSPEETVARARSRLGEREYNLVTNNCEHFAIWCKTGLEESYQVNQLGHAMGCAVREGSERIVDLLEKWLEYIL